MKFIGIDIGSTCAKTVVMNENKEIVLEFVQPTGWSSVDTAEEIRKKLVENDADPAENVCVATGYGRVSVPYADKMITEITCHAMGAVWIFDNKDMTIIDIGGQDTKIICVEQGFVKDFMMNDKCSAGTGKFLEIMANRLGVTIAELFDLAEQGTVVPISSLCTVFAESDLVHKIQMGHKKEDIIAGLCNAVANNYLNNIGKGKKILAPIVFQGGVSKNEGVVKAFADSLGEEIIVDDNGHLMGCYGAAILALGCGIEKPFSFDVAEMEFVTREVVCPNCPNHCEVICVYRDGELIDSWGNRCERGEIKQGQE